jgi:DNA-directed RNA polymerase specialized sigma subunit
MDYYKKTVEILKNYNRLMCAKDEYTIMYLKNIDCIIEKLGDIEHLVIKDYYILGNTMESIAENTDYSVNNIYQIRSKAIKQIATMLYGIKTLEKD